MGPSPEVLRSRASPRPGTTMWKRKLAIATES